MPHTHVHTHTEDCVQHCMAKQFPIPAQHSSRAISVRKIERKEEKQTTNSRQHATNLQKQTTTINTHTHHNFHVIRFTLIAVNKNADQLTTHRYRNCTQTHPCPITTYPSHSSTLYLSLSACLTKIVYLPLSLVCSLSLSCL